MKKAIVWLLVAALALPLLVSATVLDGSVQTAVPVKASYPDNPVIAGESPTTGLPFSGPYTPILMVVDNAPAAYPHWGVSQADIMFQVPNMGGGATKLLALFSDHMPTRAGGIRSARMPFVDVAFAFGAAFMFAGTPPETMTDATPEIDVYKRIRDNGYRRDTLYFDVLGNGAYHHREAGRTAPHNLVADVQQVQQLALQNGATFSPRPFKFTDAAPASDVSATQVNLTVYNGQAVNTASAATYDYLADKNAYTRTSQSGLNVDAETPDQPLLFNNLVFLRMDYRFHGNYVNLANPVGSGRADFFMGGKYIPGAWVRQDSNSRFVFTDANGEELALQRGTTFITITNDGSTLEYR